MAEGSVYKRQSDGRWCAKFRTRDGKTRVLYAATRNEARRKLRAALDARDQGLTGTNPTLGDWCGWWVQQVDVRPTTRTDYRYKLSLLPAWLTSMPLEDVTPMHVHQALDEIAATPTAYGQPRAGSTVAAVRTVLGNALHVAVRYGHVLRNAAKLAAPPKTDTPEVEPLDLAEARALLAVLEPHRLYSLYLAAVMLGLRQSEAVGLTWDRVDLARGVMTIDRQRTRAADGPPKTARSSRSLTLPTVLVTELRKHRAVQNQERLLAPGWEDRGYVWTTNTGGPQGHRNVLRVLHKACDRADVRRVSFHTLRHSAATLLLAAGVPDQVILDVLGHSDPRMLQRYAHVTDSLRQDAAGVMDAVFGTPAGTRTGAGPP